MGVMILDYHGVLTPDDLGRIAEAGCSRLLRFDLWHESEPARGEYRLDRLIEYCRAAKAVGLRVLIQTPIGSPLWAPPDWYFVNDRAQTNAFGLRRASAPYCYMDSTAMAQRFLSLWNVEAEDCTRRYVARVQAAVDPEGAVTIGSIGSCGEYMLPASHQYGFLGAGGPWWHDAGAIESWAEFQQEYPEGTRADWLHRCLALLTAERLQWYAEKWLQFVPYYESHWPAYGNVGTDRILEANREGLHTILFSVFGPAEWVEVARRQAEKYPTWAGAEGSDNVVANSVNARRIGCRGVVCALLELGYHEIRVEPRAFEELRKANRNWPSV